MKKLLILISAIVSAAAAAQSPDSLSVQRADTLEAAVFTGSSQGNYISKVKELRTEVISSAGLMKMACCNLAESFENSASVTSGYADATTGARQIRLLGLSGTYTQLLDENRPVMRGLHSPFGMSYIPGPWLESIQIAKGSPSVINGVESMTGQINLEHRKPTDERPLFLNASIMTDSKSDINIASSHQLSDKIYTIVFGHADGNFHTSDMNHDGFMDEPKSFQLNVANRWLYYTPQWQVRWGVRAIRDSRKGGRSDELWKSDVLNTSLNGYVKVGHSLREDGSASIAIVGDYVWEKTDATLGKNIYDATQNTLFANLIYRNQITESHDITAGVNATFDWWKEDMAAGGNITGTVKTPVSQWAPYIEYTFRSGDVFSAIAGLSATFLDKEGLLPAPRITMKYQPSEALVLRANGGRGLRRANPIADNIGMLSTGKGIAGDLTQRLVEDSWTYGGNVTAYVTEGLSLSLDFFRTEFGKQLLIDKESAGDGPFRYATMSLYSLDGHSSYSNNLQADINWEPSSHLNFTVTARYTDAKAWQPSSDRVRPLPLVSNFKGVFNAQYKTRLSRWTVDFTASLNGTSRVYDYMKDLKVHGELLYPHGRTPIYPMFFAQVTRKFRGFDLYVGGENLLGYKQKSPIIDPLQLGPEFDAASVWGPLMGTKVYAGIRITIWKY